MLKQNDSVKRKVNNSLEQHDEEKTELKQKIEELKKEVFRLELERDILEKATELLKKEMSINQNCLTNREKTTLIDALKTKYGINLLLKYLKMPRSSYFYNERAVKMGDKYRDIRKNVIRIFHESGDSYGYRRIYAVLKNEGYCISEKVVRRIMNEELLIVHRVKKRKYSSYKGEISPAVENVIKRDFHAGKPNEKWLTDITEVCVK